MFFQCLTLITTEESCLLHNDKTIKRTHKDILAVLRFFKKKKKWASVSKLKKKVHTNFLCHLITILLNPDTSK